MGDRNSLGIHRLDKGFTLIEVLVTLVLLSIGLLGIAQLQSAALRHTSDAAVQSRAGFLVAAVAERMRANVAAVPFYVGTISASDCTARPGPCGDSHAAGGSFCSARQLARFDVRDVFCAEHNGNPKNLVPTFQQLKIRCESHSCDRGARYRIEISWRSIALDNDALITLVDGNSQHDRKVGITVSL